MKRTKWYSEGKLVFCDLKKGKCLILVKQCNIFFSRDNIRQRLTVKLNHNLILVFLQFTGRLKYIVSVVLM